MDITQLLARLGLGGPLAQQTELPNVRTEDLPYPSNPFSQYEPIPTWDTQGGLPLREPGQQWLQDLWSQPTSNFDPQAWWPRAPWGFGPSGPSPYLPYDPRSQPYPVRPFEPPGSLPRF